MEGKVLTILDTINHVRSIAYVKDLKDEQELVDYIVNFDKSIQEHELDKILQ